MSGQGAKILRKWNLGDGPCQHCDSKLFENLVDKKRLALALGLSISYINKLMLEGLPYYKVGRSVRFRLSEAQAWLQKRRMP